MGHSKKALKEIERQFSGARRQNYKKKIQTEGVTSICKSEFFNFQRLTIYIKFRHRKCVPILI